MWLKMKKRIVRMTMGEDEDERNDVVVEWWKKNFI